jgi:D-alanyl-D-alanine carboxypeptidase/D-alanyl-D-alanine-endopeptidase (penicillin-binding protein 4)
MHKLNITFLLLFLASCQHRSESYLKDRPLEHFDENQVYNRPEFKLMMDKNFFRSQDGNTIWSVDVRAFGPKGEKVLLYTYNSKTMVRPASTNKVLTLWTYFHVFPEVIHGGPQFEELKEMMKYSDNYLAEQAYKKAEAKAGGKQAIADIFKAHGVNGVFQQDGSGLSYSNKVNAYSLVKVLATIRDGIYQKAFKNVLPIGGVDGTLAGRNLLSSSQCGAYVTAKTGTLIDDPEAALAGFAHLSNGWTIVFAMLGDSVSSVDGGRRSIDYAVCDAVTEVKRIARK